MSTYNDNLRTTVNTTLGGIDGEEQKRASALTVAHYNLYYAVGDQIRAEKKRDDVDVAYEDTWDINHEGVSCSNRATNLLTTATNADENVTATVTNTATSASNVQVAANAVLKVAAGIGSANNIVNASDYDTDIQRMTGYANKLIGETAYQAELTSQMSMESSSDAAQIIAKQVLTEATVTKTWFDDMLVRTDAQLKVLTDTRIADTDALIAANTVQRGTEGALNVANQEHSAVVVSYNTTNDTLNYDLQANTDAVDTVTSLTSINLYFEQFVPAFPLPPSPEDGLSKTQPLILGSSQLNNGYFIGLAKADTAGLFSFDVAETTFNSFQNTRFTPATPGQWQSIVLRGTDAQLTQDVDGNPIEPGIEYVAFLYIVLDHDYKKAINNYADQMSAPSLSFTLAETLADVAESPRVVGDNNFVFTVTPATGNPTTQYRGIMVPMHSLCQKDSTHCDPLTSMKLWFDLEIAEQVAEVNYQLAQPVKNANGRVIANTFEFAVDAFSPDNFGQMLEEGKAYIPMVLSIVPVTAMDADGNSNSANYLPTLSWLDSFKLAPVTAESTLVTGETKDTADTTIDKSANVTKSAVVGTPPPVVDRPPEGDSITTDSVVAAAPPTPESTSTPAATPTEASTTTLSGDTSGSDKSGKSRGNKSKGGRKSS